MWFAQYPRCFQAPTNHTVGIWAQYVWLTNNSAGRPRLRPKPRICHALMAKGWPAWRLCSCGRSFLCGSLVSAKAILSKCRANHFDLADLELAAGEATLAATVFIILSHARQKHHERALQQQLRERGARRVITVYGHVYGKTKHMGRIVKPNQITMFSIRHRWLRAAWKAILENARSPTRAVVYLECNAFYEEPTLNPLLDALVAPPHSADIRWMGWRRVHRASMWKFKHPNDVIEGSKAIGFVRGGLRRMAVALCNTPKGAHAYSDFDGVLCRRIAAKHIIRSKPSLFGMRRHKSASGSRGERIISRAAERRRG